MSGLNSCNSWKDLKKPQNPFFGAMFSRSHRKRKRKRVLQPIDHPSERGRSQEPSKNSSESTTIRSISLENQAVVQVKNKESSEKFILSTDSSLELKRPPKPQKFLPKNCPIVDSNKRITPINPPQEKSLDSSLSKYSFIDEAVMNNTISMRKKYKPVQAEEFKPAKGSRLGRKYVKSPKKLDFLPFAPDLKPVSINSFQLGITRMEFQLTGFFENTDRDSEGLEGLLQKINCKLVVKAGN